MEQCISSDTNTVTKTALKTRNTMMISLISKTISTTTIHQMIMMMTTTMTTIWMMKIMTTMMKIMTTTMTTMTILREILKVGLHQEVVLVVDQVQYQAVDRTQVQVAVDQVHLVEEKTQVQDVDQTQVQD